MSILLETFLYTTHAIVPILLIILLGYVARQVFPWDISFYRTLNGLCFRLFLPLYLFYSIYTIDDLRSINWKMIGFLVCGVLLCFVIGLMVSHFLVPQRNQKGVMIQVCFRPNSAVLGMILASSLGGEEATAFAALAIAACVPLFNLLAVIVLTIYGDNEEALSPGALVKKILRNPLILGCLCGIAVVLLRQLIPTVDGVPVFTIQNQLPSLYKALVSVADIASPLMLFVLGTRIELSSVPRLLPQISLGVFMRLVFCPGVVLGLALALQTPLGLTTLEMPTVIANCATPVAVSSAVMAQELGSDDQLASQLVVWTSVLSLFSTFCIIYLLRSFGYL